MASHIEWVAGVAGGRPRVGALGSARPAVHHQLHSVAQFAGGDGVPTTVAEAVALGRVLCRDPAGPVVHVEEELREGGKAEKLAPWTCGPMLITVFLFGFFFPSSGFSRDFFQQYSLTFKAQ